MLVLLQRPGDDVIITLPDRTEIIVTCCGLERNRVRMGYSAPRDITIDRRKVYDRKRDEANGNVAVPAEAGA